MAATDNALTSLPLPTQVTIDPASAPLHTPREMGLISSFLGKAWADMDAHEAEQAGVWLALRRMGFDPAWDDAADILVEYRAGVNPQNGGPQTTSPGSADSGE